MRPLGLLLLLAGTLGCDASPDLSPDLERMIRQARYQAYEESEYFDDHRVMRTPSANTVPHGASPGRPAITPELMVLGQDRFRISCAPCHGVSGDGDSWVALKMDVRKPPTLVGPRVRAFSDERIYRVIEEGYGLMRSYAANLRVEERWAVIAYLRALELACGVPKEALPEPLRAQAEEELR